MPSLDHRTKIVATLGPASSDPDVIRRLMRAGMNVARLNFSHGSYEELAALVGSLRSIAAELGVPITILQDLQGPKIRVGQFPFPEGQITLAEGALVTLVPMDDYHGEPGLIPIDYPRLAHEVRRGAQVLLDDGLLELAVESVSESRVYCRVVEGGVLRNRKGVLFPHSQLSVPSITDKDKQDLEFGLTLGVDWVALSFVRQAEDVRALKALLALKGASVPVIAKIEKPEAVQDLDEIMAEVSGLMVARGDLGVEMSPEKVPMIQKWIIRGAHQRGIPVITATQMLESMIHEPRPTRAEASDVANAILDGTDCVMLSGESAVGKFPVRAVEMMVRIAREVEPEVQLPARPVVARDDAFALSQAVHAIDRALALRCIVIFTAKGETPKLVSSGRPRAPVVAITGSESVFHSLNLHWGVQPIVVTRQATTFEELFELTEQTLFEKGLAAPGDRVLLVAGLPLGQTGANNFIKIHILGEATAKRG